MRKALFAIFMICSTVAASAQARFFSSASFSDGDEVAAADTIATARIGVDSLPSIMFMPLVFDHFRFIDDPVIAMPDTTLQLKYNPAASRYPANPVPEWLRRAIIAGRSANMLRDRIIYSRPDIVKYNMATLPEAPKMYHTVINPATLHFDIHEFEPDIIADVEIVPVELRKRHWIHAFSASLQFSQAYVSPNWYQGGNNNLTAIGQIVWDVKLNPAYHPNLLFENHLQYKLGSNSAPDDSLHSYNISEDILQFNSTFGIKAAKRWYYSLTAQFKTQLLTSYTANTNDMRAAFLSPGELNIGLGMTYNYANQKGTFTFDTSISPLTYNLRTCINDAIDAAAYDIPEGRHTKSKFGSSAECKLKWKITHNISFASRLFFFTDYDRLESDWENTLLFEINRFLTTQLYAHMRYDSSTPRCDDPSWHKLQVKEILSLGFAYKFASN